jgi:serine beta-lactamase-like protein LACTB
MSLIRFGIASALALLSVGSLKAQSIDLTAAQTVFDTVSDEFPAINATVMIEGEVVWEAVGGSQRGAEDGVETDYNFYSIAKMLTGMAYARLVQEEELDLDQSIRLIDPELPEAYNPVTLRHLLSHAGGVRHYSSERDWREFATRNCTTPGEALGHFIDDPLSSNAGDEMSYTTFGFTLLSHLLVRLTHTDTYDMAMQSVLGGNYLAVTDSDAAVKATNYMGEAGSFEAVEGMNAQCKFGGGGLLASSRDLSSMGAAFAAGEIIDRDSMPEMLAPFVSNSGEEIGYVFGAGAGYSERLETLYVSHSGGSPGGRAFLIVLIEPQIVVAMTSNFDGPNLGETAIGLARVFAGHTASQD